MIKKYSIERHNNYTGSLEDLHTSKGVTFFGDYRVSIDMFLTEESKNVASISFTVHKTSDVMVTTVEGRDFRGLAVRFFKIIWLAVMFIYIVSKLKCTKAYFGLPLIMSSPQQETNLRLMQFLNRYALDI